jgi:hypothetical protein
MRLLIKGRDSGANEKRRVIRPVPQHEGKLQVRPKIRVGQVAAALAAALAIALALWVTPGVPIGLEPGDYTPAVRTAILLAAGSALMGFVAFFARDRAPGERDVVEFLQDLAGRRRPLRSRGQFAHRLSRECARARRDRRAALSLILIQVAPEPARDGASGKDDEALDFLAEALANSIRTSDVVGFAGDREIGMLAVGTGARARESVTSRLEQAVVEGLHEWTKASHSQPVPAVMIGATTLTLDETPEVMLANAREALRPVAADRARAVA